MRCSLYNTLSSCTQAMWLNRDMRELQKSPEVIFYSNSLCNIILFPGTSRHRGVRDRPVQQPGQLGADVEASQRLPKSHLSHHAKQSWRHPSSVLFTRSYNTTHTHTHFHTNTLCHVKILVSCHLFRCTIKAAAKYIHLYVRLLALQETNERNLRVR